MGDTDLLHFVLVVGTTYTSDINIIEDFTWYRILFCQFHCSEGFHDLHQLVHLDLCSLFLGGIRLVCSLLYCIHNLLSKTFFLSCEIVCVDLVFCLLAVLMNIEHLIDRFL
jgi:hypothetical protein